MHTSSSEAMTNCYIANGFRDKSKDRHINIYKRDAPSLIKRKKKDIDE